MSKVETKEEAEARVKALRVWQVSDKRKALEALHDKLMDAPAEEVRKMRVALASVENEMMQWRAGLLLEPSHRLVSSLEHWFAGHYHDTGKTDDDGDPIYQFSTTAGKGIEQMIPVAPRNLGNSAGHLGIVEVAKHTRPPTTDRDELRKLAAAKRDAQAKADRKGLAEKLKSSFKTPPVMSLEEAAKAPRRA